MAWKIPRRFTFWASSACFLMVSPLLTSCLQKQDLSTDILTAVDESTPAAGAAKASGEGAGQPRGALANAAMMGGGEEAAKGTGTGTASTGASPESSDHVDRPEGYPDGATGPVPDGPTGAGSGDTKGTPEAHPHHIAKPGEGSNLPPEPKPEQIPSPDGTQPKGQPAAGGTGTPDKAPPARETQFESQYKGKPMVTVSGEIIYAGKTDQSIDLDCFAPDKSTPAGRKLVNKVKLDAVGPYSFKVPANFGKLILSGFIDLKGDGPDHNDPQGTYDGNPLEVKDKNITKVNLVLKAPAGSAK